MLSQLMCWMDDWKGNLAYGMVVDTIMAGSKTGSKA